MSAKQKSERKISKETSKTTNLTSSKLQQKLEDENKQPPKLEKTIEQTEENILENEIEHPGQEHNHLNEEENKIIQVEQKDDELIVETKPREEYLKQKMQEMNLDDNIINGVSKGLNLQIKNVEDDIDENNLLITEVKKDLTKMIKNDNEESFIKKNNINNKSFRALKELKSEQTKLKNNIRKLEENEKLIEKEGFLNLSIVDENLKRDKLKEIREKKLDANQRIDQINYQINNILAQDNSTQKNERIKLFLENFEKEKEIAELRAKKYQEESKKRKEKMKNDLDILIEKRKNEIDAKEEEEKKQSEEYLKKLKERDKETRLKIEKRKEEKLKGLKVEDYIKEKIQSQEKDYLFFQNQEKYKQKEEDLIRKETNKRKAIMRSIPLEEIKEFKENFKENKLKNEKEQQIKKEQLKEEWKERKEILPKYYSHFRDLAENDLKKIQEENEVKKNKIETFSKAKKDYSEHVISEKKPLINEKLKKKREENIIKLTEKIVEKKTLKTNKKNRILLKKRDPNKPSKFKWELKLDEMDDYDPLNKSANIKKALNKKPKRNALSSSSERKKLDNNINNLNKKKIDYLQDLKNKRKEKEEKERNKSASPIQNSNSKKWNKMIKSKNGNIIDNVDSVKREAEYLEKEAEENEKLLKIKGGIVRNPELGEKISSLLIDSIQAKLSILNHIENK